MNDTPDSDALPPFRTALEDALGAPEERGGSPNYRGRPPSGPSWTYRFTTTGSVEFRLIDQIWLSPGLAARHTGSFMLRRTKLTRDGSDHDPSWVTLDDSAPPSLEPPVLCPWTPCPVGP